MGVILFQYVSTFTPSSIAWFHTHRILAALIGIRSIFVKKNKKERKMHKAGKGIWWEDVGGSGGQKQGQILLDIILHGYEILKNHEYILNMFLIYNSI